MTIGTINFSKELLFCSVYDLNFLSRYCSFWEQLVLRGSIWSFFFQNKTCSRPFFELVFVLSEEKSINWPFIFLTVLPSFGGSTWGISSFTFFNGEVAPIHSFRVYTEQIVFDSSYWLKPTIFLEDLSFTFDLFKDRLFI